MKTVKISLLQGIVFVLSWTPYSVLATWSVTMYVYVFMKYFEKYLDLIIHPSEFSLDISLHLNDQMSAYEIFPFLS